VEEKPDSTASNPVVVEHPRGIYPGKLDDKGRLKLPSDFQEYFQQLGEKKVFATSFDGRIGRIYTISTWKDIEALLRQSGDDAEAAEDLWFTAMDLGGDAEIDAQGRMLIPSELRQELKIEGQQVFLEYFKGHVNLYSKEVYEEKKQRARERRGAALQTFEKKGLQ
jgi:MraZ protein